ncbi:T9SS type A sorting domain-containing protein [Subsaxibacter sp. CAU 1640]|uniref:T9SS type A sorting domain-containing protein n=1 Tax=Subsaxibacter sp. CAU 1640 TaxID=2933271 RepID=UPI00200538EA|nr:T9SS type A sorting domain-containing protein [Subsaxibacter sp. CAU 1640]MCK7589193.1 T9SS type A sorting domain-containing protein [Subsaxibacter sp. CAU 1640]
MKHIYALVSFFFALSYGNAQTVNIPDTNFLNFLISIGADLDGDNQIQYSEAETIDFLTITNNDIVDMTGMEAFTNLTALSIYGSSLSSLSLTGNTALIDLEITATQLTNLDFSNNTLLETIYLTSNVFTSLDFSNNPNLVQLYIHNHSMLTNVVLADHPVMEFLEVSGNEQLTYLDLSTLYSLTTLIVPVNQFTDINVSTLTDLAFLQVYNNQLTALDVSNNSALIEINAMFNELTGLDLSNNFNLVWLNVSNNALETMDVRNGNNQNIVNFNGNINPNLTCIYVDDPTASYLPNWNVDASSTFVENEEECNALSINDIEKAPTLRIYPNPVVEQLTIESTTSIAAIAIYDINGRLLQEYKPESNTHTQIDFQEFSKGIYLCKIISNNKQTCVKIIKQ